MYKYGILFIEKGDGVLKFKKLLILFIPLALICIFFVWHETCRHVVSSPDKIIIHNNGIQKELNKNSKDFNKIVKLTNQRFPNELYGATDFIDTNAMNYIYDDGIGIEFVYSKEQTLSMANVPTKYYRLYFQLTSKEYKGTSPYSPVNTFQCGDQYEFYGFTRGILAYSPELVNLIKSIK